MTEKDISQIKHAVREVLTEEELKGWYSMSQLSKILRVSRSTIWRWAKEGRLSRKTIGGKKYYQVQ